MYVFHNMSLHERLNKEHLFATFVIRTLLLHWRSLFIGKSIRGKSALIGYHSWIKGEHWTLQRKYRVWIHIQYNLIISWSSNYFYEQWNKQKIRITYHFIIDITGKLSSMYTSHTYIWMNYMPFLKAVYESV